MHLTGSCHGRGRRDAGRGARGGEGWGGGGGGASWGCCGRWLPGNGGFGAGSDGRWRAGAAEAAVAKLPMVANFLVATVRILYFFLHRAFYKQV
jgi:hypothetical protein